MITIHYINNGSYCSSRELHQLFGKAIKNYARDVKKWFNTEYLFQDKKELTKPVAGYDYILVNKKSHSSPLRSGDSQSVSRVTQEGQFAEEFMIRLELVKLITLDTSSRVKKKFVQWLLSLEQRVDRHELISPDLLFGLLELAKLCTYMDRQIQYYNEHKQFFQAQVEDNRYYEFDTWRNALLKISNASTIKMQYKSAARIGNLITKREQENSINPYQGIRDAIFDFLKMQYNQIDYFFPESTEKSLNLANITERILKIVNDDRRPDIKPRGYEPSLQQDWTRPEGEETNIEMINHLITKGIIASIN